MTKEEIVKKCSWDRYDMATLEIDIPVLTTSAQVNFLPGLKSGRLITADMAKALNDVINLNADQIAEIKNHIFRYFNLCCEVTDYGFDIDFIAGEARIDANKRYFDVKNEDDSWKKSKLEFITIEEDKEGAVTLQFDVPWDDEHGCEIEIVNGVIVKDEK